MTARSCVFQIYQPNSQNGFKASSSLISDCFFVCVCFFFISIREQSGQRLFFSVFWMQQSITSLYFPKLLPICTGERSHFFSLNLRASLVLHILGTSLAFVKKRIGLCFTDGNMWPSKISNAPPPPPPQKKIGRGPNMALKITDLGTTQLH